MSLPPLPTGTNNRGNRYYSRAYHRKTSRADEARGVFSADPVPDAPPGPVFDEANIFFLMTMDDGTNGAADAADQSDNSLAITYLGGATLTNTVVRDGKLLSLDALGNNGIRIALDGALGSDDFCIEAWRYVTSFDSTWENFICHVAGTTDTRIFFTETQSPDGYQRAVSDNFATTPITGDTASALNTWEHVALSREGTTIRLFQDGAVVATTTVDALDTFGSTPTGNMWFGLSADSPNSAQDHNVYFSDIRVVIGQPVYTGEYTPPTSLARVE